MSKNYIIVIFQMRSWGSGKFSNLLRTWKNCDGNPGTQDHTTPQLNRCTACSQCFHRLALANQTHSPGGNVESRPSVTSHTTLTTHTVTVACIGFLLSGQWHFGQTGMLPCSLLLFDGELELRQRPRDRFPPPRQTLSCHQPTCCCCLLIHQNGILYSVHRPKGRGEVAPLSVVSVKRRENEANFLISVCR